MRMKSTLLTGTAGAIAALVLITAPALSQSRDNDSYSDGASSYRHTASSPQDSTPAEHARTEQLNSLSRNGLDASPAVLNGTEAGGLPRARATDAQRSGAYQDRVQTYNDDMRRYQDQRIDYRQAVGRYDRAQWRFDNYPQDVSYNYEGGRIEPVSRMANAGRRLYLASVRSRDGWVGKVMAVRISAHGRAVSVEIAIDRRFAVWVSPARLRFDPRSGVVFTDLSRDQLWDMPGGALNTLASR